MGNEKILIEFDTEKREVTGVTLNKDYQQTGNFKTKKREVTGVTLNEDYQQIGNFKENGCIKLKKICDISEITLLYIENSPGHWCIINRRKYWCP